MSNREKDGVRISAIIQKIEDKYRIKIEQSKRETFQQKLKSVCKSISVSTTDQDGDRIKTNLWAVTECLNGKKVEHYFLESEVARLLNSLELDRYIKANLLNYTESEKYTVDEELAKKWNKQYPRIAEEDLDYAIESREHGENPSYVSYGEARAKALEIMIEALFLRHFEPIDIELLRSDMETQSVMETIPDEHTVETVRACRRLMNLQGYCKPRKEEEKN